MNAKSIITILSLLKNCVILLMMFSLASCFRESGYTFDEYPTANNKTITVKVLLPNYKLRANVEPTLTGVGVVIQHIDIYFYNIISGVIYTKVSLSTDEITKILSGDGLTFSNLNMNVGGIAVIANNNEDKGLSMLQGESIHNLFSKELNIAHEQILQDITLYAKDETFTQINSKNSINNTPHHTTDITIKPLVARMEVSEIQCLKMDVHGNIRKLKLHSVFINNTYQNRTLDTEKQGANNLHLADALTVESHPLDWWVYSYTSDFPEIPSNNPHSSFSPDVNDPTKAGDGVFTFHFIPSNLTPSVGIYMFSDGVTNDWYLHIRNFVANETKVIFEDGFIYKVKVSFIEKDLTDFENKTKDLIISIEVLNWTIINEIQPS